MTTGLELTMEGWREVRHSPPPPDWTVEFARDHRVAIELPFFAKWKDLDPKFNVAGLYWRPVLWR